MFGQSEWPEYVAECIKSVFGCCLFGGCLLSVGGGEAYKPTACSHLCILHLSWEQVADLPVVLSGSSAISLQTGELLIAGGILEEETGVFCAGIIKGKILCTLKFHISPDCFCIIHYYIIMLSCNLLIWNEISTGNLFVGCMCSYNSEN